MQEPADVHREAAGRLLRPVRGVYPLPAHPHRGVQLCQLLQEQALEERGRLQEGRQAQATQGQLAYCQYTVTKYSTDSITNEGVMQPGKFRNLLINWMHE